MNITTKTQYGLRAVINLARSEDDKPKSLSQIAKEEGISFSYLQQIFADLKKSKLVKSVRGASGGYSLANTPEKIPVKNIVAALEEPLVEVSCTNGKCDKEYGCKAKLVWNKVNDAISKTLNNLTLKDLI